jgi:hypothetical protein
VIEADSGISAAADDHAVAFETDARELARGIADLENQCVSGRQHEEVCPRETRSAGSESIIDPAQLFFNSPSLKSVKGV